MPETLYETLAALLAHLENEDITSSYEERHIFVGQSVHLARTALQQAQAEDTPYKRNVLAAARDVRHMGVVFQVSGPWHHPAQSALGRLVDAARQPEEAADDTSA